MPFSPMEAALPNYSGNDKNKYVVLPLYPFGIPPPLQTVVFISRSTTWSRVTKLAYDDVLKSVNKLQHSYDHLQRIDLYQNQSRCPPCKNHSIQTVPPFCRHSVARAIVTMPSMVNTSQTPPMHPLAPKKSLEHRVLERKNGRIVKLSYRIMQAPVRMQSWRRTLSTTRSLPPWISISLSLNDHNGNDSHQQVQLRLIMVATTGILQVLTVEQIMATCPQQVEARLLLLPAAATNLHSFKDVIPMQVSIVLPFTITTIPALMLALLREHLPVPLQTTIANPTRAMPLHERRAFRLLQIKEDPSCRQQCEQQQQ